MDGNIPSYLAKLLVLLDKPNSLKIAEKLVKCMTNKRRAVTDYQQLNSSCVCSTLARLDKPNVCNEFHWNCMLGYLIQKTNTITDDNVIQSINFFNLNTHVQNQFLSLLIKVYVSIPKTHLEKFVNSIKSSLCNNINDWTNYLIRKLALCYKDDEGDGCHCTALHHQTIDRVKDVLGQTDAVICVESFWGTSHGEEEDLKRKRDETNKEDNCLDSKRFKREPSPLRGDLLSRAGPVASPLMATAVISEEIHVLNKDIKCAVIAVKEAWGNGHMAPIQDFNVIVNLTYKELEMCLSHIKLEEMTDSTLIAILDNITNIGSDDIGFQNQSLILQHLITPQLWKIQKLASRTLLASLSKVVKKYPLASVDGLLYPFVLVMDFNAYHYDVMNRLLKESVSNQQRNHLWSKLCVTSLDINGKFFIWNEHHIGLLQLLVQKGVAISDSTIDNFIQTLQTNSSYLNGSLKFAQLFCSLLRKNSNELANYVDVLIDISECNNTMLQNQMRVLADSLPTS